MAIQAAGTRALYEKCARAHDDDEPVGVVFGHLEARVVACQLAVDEGSGLRRRDDGNVCPAA